MTVASDTIIIALPIYELLKLSLNWERKLSVIEIFMVGFS